MKRSLPVVQSKRVIRALERAGFVLHRINGSHYILKHPSKPMLRGIVPFHNRDLKKGTLQAIIKQAGFTSDEFLKLL